MNLSYYPGCSLHGSSREYDRSTRAVCLALGIDLIELDDWVCCGASSAHSLNHQLGLTLPAKNLKLAADSGRDLLVPCAACYNRLKSARKTVTEDASLRRTVSGLTDYGGGGAAVLNWIELLTERVGLDALRTAVRKPLAGLRAAPYYGCLLVRPAGVMAFDHPEHPRSMDAVLRAVGAEPLTWSSRAECCGGSLALSRGEIVTQLVDGIVRSAREAGANAIVSVCPLCLENLDARQTQARIPVLYLTELLGLSLGLDEARGWMAKHMTDPSALLESLRLMP